MAAKKRWENVLGKELYDIWSLGRTWSCTHRPYQLFQSFSRNSIFAREMAGSYELWKPGAISTALSCLQAVTMRCCKMSKIRTDRRLSRWTFTNAECVSQPANSNCCSKSRGKFGINRVVVFGPKLISFMHISIASCTRWYCQTRSPSLPYGSCSGNTCASKSCPCSSTMGVQKLGPSSLLI